MKITLLASVAVAILALTPAQGRAQSQAQTPSPSGTVPEGVGVADRARPDYAPIGGRIGSFFLYPSASVDFVATDNVRATPANTISDVFALLHGEVRLASNLARNRLDTRVYVDDSVHIRAPGEDAAEYGAQVDGRLDLRRTTTVTTTLIAEHQAEDRTGYDSQTNARSRVRYGHYQASALLAQDLSVVTLSGGFVFNRYAYSDSVTFAGQPLSERYRSFSQYELDGAATFTFHPGLSVVARGSYDTRDYDLPASSPLQPGQLERGSSGGRIEGGIRLDITSLLYGEVRVGYLVRNYRDAQFRDTSGLSFGANLLWNVTPLTTIRFEADRRIDEASSTLISGNRDSVFLGQVDHELLRNLILHGSLRYALIEPLGPLDSSSEYGASAGARYLFNRRFTTALGYTFAKRTSPLIDRRFTENRLVAQVKLTL